VSKAKKKVAKKTAVSKKPSKLPAGARDIGFRESKLAEAVLRAEVDEVRASVDDEPAPVCAAFNCYEHVADYGDHCAKHAPSEPHVVSAASTDEEIAASDNAVIRETHAKLSVRAPGHGSEDTDPSPLSDARNRPGAPPEKHTYVPPEPAPRPVLPDLTQRTLKFHTPPGRQGMCVNVAFALLLDEGVVIRRTTDRLIGTGSVRYSLAGVGDLDTVQCHEVGSHYWYDATDEEEAALAKCEYERSISLDEAIEHWGRLQTQAAEDTDNPAAQHRARLYGRTVESLVLEKQTGTPHCVDHLEPIPCKIHALALAGRP
jgi:hypothetical protein